MHQYVDVTEADCLAPRSDVGRDWWPPWWPAGPTGQMSWQLCFCGGKTADREWGRHQRGEDQENCSSGSAEMAELNVRAIHPSIWLIWQNNVDVWNYVVAAHCHWQSLADINSNQINAAKNSVLAFLSIVPWLRCVTPFVFAFFVIVFVFCVFVFGFEFCFFAPWLRCVTPPSARIGPSPISENTSIRLPHQTGNIRMNKTLCTKKMFVQNWSLYIIQHYQRQSRRSVTSVKFD